MVLLGCRAGALAGSLSGPVAGSVHEDLVAGVDQPVEEGLGDDGVGEQGVPVAGPGWRSGSSPAGALGDEFVEVVGLGCGELAHREVVEDQEGGADEFAEAFVPAAVGVSAGQVGRARLVLVKRTSAPRRMARWPRAWATWLFPTPTGP